MFRKRERFERTDVIQPGARTNFLGVVVLAVVAASLAALLIVLWGKANRVATMNDEALIAALGEQPEVWAVDGASASRNNFTNTLVLTVDNPRAKTPRLTGVSIMVLDATDSTGAIASLPLSTAVKVGDGDAKVTMSVEQLFQTQGAAACVAPLSSAANVRFAHVIVADDQLFDQLGTFEGVGLRAMLGRDGSLIETITTDMGAKKLGDVAKLAQAIGMDALVRFDAPTEPVQGDDGSALDKLSWRELDVQLGLFVRAQ